MHDAGLPAGLPPAERDALRREVRVLILTGLGLSFRLVLCGPAFGLRLLGPPARAPRQLLFVFFLGHRRLYTTLGLACSWSRGRVARSTAFGPPRFGRRRG